MFLYIAWLVDYILLIDTLSQKCLGFSANL